MEYPAFGREFPPPTPLPVIAGFARWVELTADGRVRIVYEQIPVNVPPVGDSPLVVRDAE